MKKRINQLFLSLALVCTLGFFSSANLQAQKIAVVDINAVLESMDDYKNAQTELDRTASQWRQEIAQEYDKIKGMYSKYQAEMVLMSDDMKRQKEDEIMAKEQQVREMQKQKFGPEGALFKKRKDLVQPIQDKVYDAIEKYAGERGYDFIFDKSSASGIIFNNSRFDKTEDILTRIK